MERGGVNGDQWLPKSSSSSGVTVSEKKKQSSNKGSTTDKPETAYMVREQDRFMPIANVIRIMRTVLPTHAKISDDAKETIQECVSEYISFVTSEANERCRQEQRKTITADDIIWAMSKLGFDNYVEPLTHFLQRYRELEGDRGSARGDPLAVKRNVVAGGMSSFNVAPIAPAFPMAMAQYPGGPGMYGAVPASAPMMGGYFMDGSGSSSTQMAPVAPLASYDPYALYKGSYNNNGN